MPELDNIFVHGCSSLDWFARVVSKNFARPPAQACADRAMARLWRLRLEYFTWLSALPYGAP